MPLRNSLEISLSSRRSIVTVLNSNLITYLMLYGQNRSGQNGFVISFISIQTHLSVIKSVDKIVK